MQTANFKLVGTAALRRPRHRAQRQVDGTEVRNALFYHVRCAATRRGQRSALSLPGWLVMCVILINTFFTKLYEI